MLVNTLKTTVDTRFIGFDTSVFTCVTQINVALQTGVFFLFNRKQAFEDFKKLMSVLFLNQGIYLDYQFKSAGFWPNSIKFAHTYFNFILNLSKPFVINDDNYAPLLILCMKQERVDFALCILVCFMVNIR